jgi:hypothetical protein
MTVHQHLIDEHTDAIERDDTSTYRLHNPEGDDVVVTAEAGIEDEDTLDRFSNEVAVLAFDKLLSRIEE